MKTEVNVNLESKTVEKGIDAAKGFLSKLLSPGINEIGLLIKDHVAAVRFKNQINLLNKTELFCKKNNINPKVIPLKLLYPLIESASLEEDEEIQDRWAILLSNLVDSEQNIQNHVFPFLLGQISKREFEIMESAVIEKTERVKKNAAELNKWFSSGEKKLESLKKERNKLPFNDVLKRELSNEISKLEQMHRTTLSELTRPQKLDETELQEFEFSNLLRLGLISSVPLQYGYVPRHTAKLDTYGDSVDLTDLDVRIENDGNDFLLSQLGELFIKACREKNNQ